MDNPTGEMTPEERDSAMIQAARKLHIDECEPCRTGHPCQMRNDLDAVVSGEAS